MARPATKDDLMKAADSAYKVLMALVDGLSERELTTAFDFSRDAKKTEAHWRRDRNLRDVLVHLYEWHQLLLRWIQANMAGERRDFLPEGYNWKTYGDMNAAFWEKHQATSLEEAKAMLEDSHHRVMAVISPFTNEELFSKGAFPWTGASSLGSYCVSATSSHYDWAARKLKAHQKRLREAAG